jgi:hypothetical protein
VVRTADRSIVIELAAERLWEREVHGTAGQQPMFDPNGTAIDYSDGWGRRPAPSLRFRRLDVLTGAETATWPCGSAVRCLVLVSDADLLVATDQRLVRLDGETLAERERWEPSVQHATTLAVHDRVAVAGNRVTASVAFVDLETGRVRRRRHGPVAAILTRRGGPPIVVGAADGGMSIADTRNGTLRPVRSAPPAMAAALADDEQGVWLVPGAHVRITEQDAGVSIRPGDPGMTVDWYPFGDGAVRSLPVPVPVRTVEVDHDALWLTPAAISGSEQYVVIGAVSGNDWRIWHPPERALVAAVAPSLGLVLTTTHRPGAETTVLGCHRIDR